MILISICSFVLVFLTVALAHEIGHFILAKRAGIKVLELGIGFGPNIYKKEVNGTIYSVSLFPVLAFVRLAGIDEENEQEKNCPEEEKYYTKKPLQKFLAISAGPVMNLILGVMIFSALAISTGLPELSPEVSSVTLNSAAQKAGLIKGDVIVAYQGKQISDMFDVISDIHKSSGKTVALTILRDHKTLNIIAIPAYDKKLKAGLLGFSLKQINIKYDFFSGLLAGIKKTAIISVAIVVVVFQLVIGRISVFDLAGPIGIAQFSGAAASQGVVPFLLFTAFISINLGILNLLPIPALDGGRLVFVLVEWLRRKPIKIDTENKIHQYGLILLLFLMFFVSINDIIRIISAKFIK